MLYLILFGAPGSGKGTQSDLLVEKYHLTHLSTGDLLRGEIASGSELGKTLNAYISQGNLIPDAMMIEMLGKEIDKHTATSKGFILDGFPRTVEQAEALQEMLTSREGSEVLLLEMTVEREELVKRLLKRGETSGRSDDNLETITKRLEVYEAKTKPVNEYYKARGLHAGINGMGTVEEIFGRINEVLNGKI